MLSESRRAGSPRQPGLLLDVLLTPLRRVHARRQAKSRAHALQQLEQLLALQRAQIAAQLLLVGDGDPKRTAEQLASGLGHVQRMDAPVGGVLAALDQPVGFVRVDEGDHATRWNPHPLADRLLEFTGALVPGNKISFDQTGKPKTSYLMTQNLPNNEVVIVWPSSIEGSKPAMMPMPGTS